MKKNFGDRKRNGFSIKTNSRTKHKRNTLKLIHKIKFSVN